MSEKKNSIELNIDAKEYMPMNGYLRQHEEEIRRKKYFDLMSEYAKKTQIEVGEVYSIKEALGNSGIPSTNHKGSQQCVIDDIDDINVYIYLLNSQMSPSVQNNTKYQKKYISIDKNSLIGGTNKKIKVNRLDFLNKIDKGQITRIGVCNEDDLKKIQQAVNTDMLKKAIERQDLKQSVKKMKNGEINPYCPPYNQQYDDYYGYNQMYNTSNMYGNNQYNNYYPGY